MRPSAASLIATMSLSPSERLDLKRNCADQVHGFVEPSPAALFHQLGEWCEQHQIAHDVYGEGPLIEQFQNKIAALLGKPSALFFPSGTMAQLVAVRIWTERSHLNRFGLHASSHLALHEAEAYQALFALHGMLVGEPERTIGAADVAQVGEPLACLLIELPMREIGGQLPSWEALDALKAQAHASRIPLHMDGARLWECQAYYQRSFSDIAAGFGSVYVSVYKGLGGIAGALLAGDQDFIARARQWRRRLGGTLVHQSPMIASAAMQFDRRLALLEPCYRRALEFARALSALQGIRCLPKVPQTNLLHVCFDRPVDALLDARDEIAKSDGVWLFGHARMADIPGWSRTEIYVGDGLLALDDDKLMPLFERLIRVEAKRR